MYTIRELIHPLCPVWMFGHLPINTTHRPNAGLMLIQRLRRWPSLKTALGKHLVFAGLLVIYLLLPDYSLIGSESSHIHHPTVQQQSVHPSNTRYSPNVVLMLCRRQRRRFNIRITLGQGFVLDGQKLHSRN